MSAVENFKAILKASGQSVTAARLAVFEALLTQEPMSIHQLTERVGDVDRSSVYRSVELFERVGIVQRVNIGWKYKLELTDKFAEHHHHLTCTHCGRTIAMNEDELERMINDMAVHHRFRPMAHQIEIQGLCESCQ